MRKNNDDTGLGRGFLFNAVSYSRLSLSALSQRINEWTSLLTSTSNEAISGLLPDDSTQGQGMSRRTFVRGAALMASATALGACSATTSGPRMVNTTMRSIDSAVIPYTGDEPRNTILISHDHSELYHVLGNGRVRAYTITVPPPHERANFPRHAHADGTGYMQSDITEKRPNPIWTPTASIRRRYFQRTGEEMPRTYQGGEEGNALGVYALTLRRPFLIHGTNNLSGLGTDISAGCYRMRNEDVVELANAVNLGTIVKIYDRNIPGIRHQQRTITHSARPRRLRF